MAEPSQAFLESCRNTKPKAPKSKCPACPLIDCAGLCDNARGAMNYLSGLVANRRGGNGKTDAELASALEEQVDIWVSENAGHG